MVHTKTTDRDEARKQLLREGARSYLQAATALIEYQREVQKSCQKVMERYVDEYASALKVTVPSDTGAVVNLNQRMSGGPGSALGSANVYVIPLDGAK